MQTYNVNLDLTTTTPTQEEAFVQVIQKGYQFPLKATLIKAINKLKDVPTRFWKFVLTHSIILLAFSYLPEAELLTSIYSLLIVVKALKLSNQLTNNLPIEVENIKATAEDCLNLFVLGLKQSLFILMPLVLVLLLTVIFHNHTLNYFLYALLGLWSIYYLVSFSLASLLLIVYKVDDWKAMELSRQLVRSHWWVFFALFTIWVLPVFLGAFGSFFQTSLTLLISLMYCMVIGEAVSGNER